MSRQGALRCFFYFYLIRMGLSIFLFRILCVCVENNPWILIFYIPRRVRHFFFPRLFIRVEWHWRHQRSRAAILKNIGIQNNYYYYEYLVLIRRLLSIGYTTYTDRQTDERVRWTWNPRADCERRRANCWHESSPLPSLFFISLSIYLSYQKVTRDGNFFSFFFGFVKLKRSEMYWKCFEKGIVGARPTSEPDHQTLFFVFLFLRSQ